LSMCGIGLALGLTPAAAAHRQVKSGWVFCWSREGLKVPTRYLFTSPIRSELAANIDDIAFAKIVRAKGLSLGLDDGGNPIPWSRGCSQAYATKDEVPAASRAYYEQLKTSWARRGWTMNYYVVINWPESSLAPGQ